MACRPLLYPAGQADQMGTPDSESRNLGIRHGARIHWLGACVSAACFLRSYDSLVALPLRLGVGFICAPPPSSFFAPSVKGVVTATMSSIVVAH